MKFISILLAGCIFLLAAKHGSCQGMVAVPVSSQEEPNHVSSQPNSQQSGAKFGGTDEDKEKAERHKKIAESHLHSKEDGSTDSVASGANIVRKDKSADLQNAQKHASEGWLVQFLLDQYILTETSEANVNEQVDILQNLEHYSHKYENGRDLFQSTNALKKILLPALNSSYPEIRKAACGVFAVAAQNNAVVQETSLQNGVIRRLVHLLTFDLASVRSKALYALASLLRNFPEAQRKFIMDGGISALVKAATLSETRKRSLNVVTDLLLERRYCREGADEDVEDNCDMERLLEKALELNGWCDVLVDSLSNVHSFDTENQILITDAVEAGLSICRDRIAPYATILHRLLIKFEQEKDFTGNAEQQVQTILAEIDPLALSARDEL